MKRVDHIVVGAGVMGSAAALSLSKAGKKVVLLEQYRPGHKRGSSHGRSRIFRYSYTDPMYVAMAQESLLLWRELEREVETQLVRTTGGLDVGPDISRNAAALDECGASYELITGSEVAERFSSVSLPAQTEVLYQPDAGVIAADAAIASFITSAMDASADIHEERQVIAIEPTDRSVTVRTPGGDFEGDSLVVTAGAWAQKLLASIGIDLPVRPTRETVSYFHMDTTDIPTFVEWGDPSIYALPSSNQGLKVGEHIAGPTADPDEDQPVNHESVARVQEWVAERFPSAERDPHLSETCFYTNTADEHFILERHGNIVVGSACSGHGFKFAPVIGKRLAELALD